MRLQSIIGIITTLSLASVGLAGCTTQQAQSNSDTPENSPIAQTQEATPTPQPQEGKPDVPYLPTPNEVVEAMLELAKVNSNDVLYDLGSGDGRIPITAAQKFGTRATGVEIDPYLVEKSRANAQQAGVADRVKFLQQDLFKTDLSDATVVTLYCSLTSTLSYVLHYFDSNQALALSHTLSIWGTGNLIVKSRFRRLVLLVPIRFITGLSLEVSHESYSRTFLGGNFCNAGVISRRLTRRKWV